MASIMMQRIAANPYCLCFKKFTIPTVSAFKKSITTSSMMAAASITLTPAKNERFYQQKSILLRECNLNAFPMEYHKQHPITGQLQSLRNYNVLQRPVQFQSANRMQKRNMSSGKDRRSISVKAITKNLTLYTNGPCKSEIDQKTLEIKPATGNPLVVIMAWMMAQQKHIKKYAEIYIDLGFDVMVVQITPWQLLWPVKGSQVVATEALKFLENNKSYEPIVLHGFSVGGYQMGEIMLIMSKDMERYQPILNRFVCQIWDSAADITEIPIGLPRSLFPNNPRMQSALRNYTLYHMKTFHNQATVHYMRSSQMFHSTLVKAPALFLISENDAIGPPKSNAAVRENWERANIKTTFKCWEKSKHAAHLITHREEYLEYLFKHLEESGVLERIGVQSRAKL